MRSSEEKKKSAAGEAGAQGKCGSKKKIYLTRAAGAAILLAVILAVNYAASWCFDDIHGADFYKYDIDRLEKEHADVDMIIVGASQIYHACNPDVISGEMGIGEVIDCSSASANNDGQYFMLRDLLRRFDPEYVVLDAPWSKFLAKSEESVNRGKLLISDRLKWLDKLDYAMHCFNLEQTLNLLFPTYRFGGNIWGTTQLKQNFYDRKAVREGNLADEYKQNYRKNGFYWYKRGIQPGGIPAEVKHYSDDEVSEYEYKWTLKIWELCQEYEVPVVWTSMPTSMEKVFSVDDYQGSVDYMKEFTQKLGCPYLNYNLLKDRDKILPETVYTDELHLNGEGSIIFSKIFAKTVKMAFDGEDTSEYFYDSIDEMKQEVHRVVACNAKAVPDGNGNVMVEAMSLHNDGIIPEYRLLVVSNADLKNSRVDREDTGINDSRENDGDMSGEVDPGGGEADDAGEKDNAGEADDVGEKDSAGEEDDIGEKDNAKEKDDADARDSTGAGTGEGDVGTEIRPWQDSPSFVVGQSEIPAGCFLRLEAREKGQTEEYCFVNDLKSWYVKL